MIRKYFFFNKFYRIVYAISAGGLGFESQAGQSDTVPPPLRRFFGAVLPRR